MSDLRQIISELSTRQMTRKQFLGVVGGSILGMVGVFRFLQAVNTPPTTNNSRGFFGEKEYGHTDTVAQAKAPGYNSGDVFG